MPQSPLKAQLEKFKKKFARHLLLFIEKKSLDINVSFLLLSLEKLEYFDVRRGFSVLAGKKKFEVVSVPPCQFMVSEERRLSWLEDLVRVAATKSY